MVKVQTTQEQQQINLHINSDQLSRRDIFALVILQAHLDKGRYLTPNDLASKVAAELDKVMAVVNK